NQAQYYFHRGMARTHLAGQEQAAVEDFTRSIALYPDHPGPYHLRGKLYVNALEKYEEAIVDFDKLLSLREHPEGFQLRGYAKLQLGDAEGALADLEQSRTMAPAPYTDYLAACACAELGREEEMYDGMARTLEADSAYREYFESDEEFE